MHKDLYCMATKLCGFMHDTHSQQYHIKAYFSYGFSCKVNMYNTAYFVSKQKNNSIYSN